MVFDWFKRLLKKNQALDLINQTNTQTNNQASLEFDKESVQLGLAAGYTGRSIHDINDSLNRIETLMPSKDWLLIQLEQSFRQHEENEQKRLEIILGALNSLHLLSSEVPEPLKTKISNEIRTIESSLELSKRMKELIQLVKYFGKAPYADLAQKMGITQSAFRSLLSLTMPRTDELEKIEENNKKYLKYKGYNSASSSQSSVQTDQNQSNEQTNAQTDA